MLRPCWGRVNRTKTMIESIAVLYGWTPDEKEGAKAWLLNMMAFYALELRDGSEDETADLSRHPAHIALIAGALGL